MEMNMDEFIGREFIGGSDSFLNSDEMVELTGLDLIQPSRIVSDLSQDDTLDAATKFYVPSVVPVSPRGPPQRDIFAGDLNFEVEVNSKDVNKKKYLYSHLLNRIYVDMHCDFPMQFNWEHGKGAATMYVRSTVVFSDEAQAEKRVETCLQHLDRKGCDDTSQQISKNVLHSSRALNTEGVYYCGSPEAPDSWYSLVVQLTKTGAEPCKHAYKFVCKNSCSTGINRRPIMIIFTLEDLHGNVFGRQIVGARVCSCPRRDIGKDEEAEGALVGGNKRKVAKPAASPPRSKKIKLEVVETDTDDAVKTLPPLQVIGSRALATGLEVMLSMMQQAADLNKNNPQAAEKYSKVIAEFKRGLDAL